MPTYKNTFVPGVPAPVNVVALKHLNAYSGDTTRTATSLNEPPQKCALLDVHGEDRVLELVDYAKMLVGSMCHRALEEAVQQPVDHDSGKWVWGGDPADIAITGEAETRIYATIAGMEVSGQFDYLDKGVLFDYKFCSAWGGVFNPDHEDYQQQGWNLRTLMAEDGREDPVECRTVMFYTDWSRAKAGDGKYPKYPIEVFTHPPKPLAECQAYTRERVRLHQQNMQALDLGDALTPCTDQERWARFRKGKPPTYTKCEQYCNAEPWCSQHTTKKEW